MYTPQKRSEADDLLEFQLGSQGVITGSSKNSLGLASRHIIAPIPDSSGYTPRAVRREGTGLSDGVLAVLLMPGLFLMTPILVPLEKILSSSKLSTFFIYVGGGIGLLASLDSLIQSWGTSTLASLNIPDGLNNIIVSICACLLGAGLGSLFLQIIEGIFVPLVRLSSLVISFAIYLGLTWVSYHAYLNYFSGNPVPWLEAVFDFVGSLKSSWN